MLGLKLNHVSKRGHCKPSQFNPLAPGKFEWNFIYNKKNNLKQISVIDGWSISCEIALIWMSLDFSDDQSKLVQVMAWCHQATSHYLSQCWPRPLLPYGVTRPQWVKGCGLTSIEIPMIKIRCSHYHLDFTMGIPTAGKKILILKRAQDIRRCTLTV